jgi:methyltransferase (TIGR00027 family)
MSVTRDEGTGPALAGRPKGLAQLWALMQAYHQLTDDPVIFADPLAVPIVGLSPTGLAAFFDGVSGRPIRRQYSAARARFADDIVTASASAGVRQVVILSAGLDTFAYRTTLPVRTWEIDDAESQAWKRWRLTDARIAIPDTVRFVPVDPTTTPIAGPLADAGFDPNAATIFLWLGCMATGTETAVLDLLRFIGGLAEAQFVFDYLEPPAPVTPEARLAYQTTMDVAAALDAPLRMFFTPERMNGLLREFGFTKVNDTWGLAVMARYQPVPITENQTLATHFIHARRGR